MDLFFSLLRATECLSPSQAASLRTSSTLASALSRSWCSMLGSMTNSLSSSRRCSGSSRPRCCSRRKVLRNAPTARRTRCFFSSAKRILRSCSAFCFASSMLQDRKSPVYLCTGSAIHWLSGGSGVGVVGMVWRVWSGVGMVWRWVVWGWCGGGWCGVCTCNGLGPQCLWPSPETWTLLVPAGEQRRTQHHPTTAGLYS